MRTTTLALALCTLLLVACDRAEPDPSTGTIVYVKGPEIRSIQPDGSDNTLLAAIGDERTIRDMAVDDRGERIAFVDDSMMQNGAAPQIVVMNADGTGRHVAIGSSELPEKTWDVWSIAWSPQGGQLAVCVSGDRSFILAIDGSSSHSVGVGSFCVTDWSDDGSRLLGTDRGVVEMDTDGSNRRLLIDHRAAKDPAWSPDGTQILYQGGRQGAVLARSDGSDQHQLDLSPFSEAAWSPDGSKIVYVQGLDFSMGTMSLSNGDGSQVLPARPPDNGWPALPSWRLLT